MNDDARTVTLSCIEKGVAEAVARGPALAFNTICVGMLVNATIEKVVQNGLLVSFLGMFHGVVDEVSFSSFSSSSSLKFCIKSTTQKQS